VQRGYRGIGARVEPRPEKYGRSVVWILGGVTGDQSGSTSNEVGSITTAHAGAVARLHDRGGISLLAMSLSSCVTGSPTVSLKGSIGASDALRSVLMQPDAFSP